MAEAERRWIVVGGGRVRLYSWGEGPAVLLVHGWNSRASRFLLLIGLLRSAGYRVVAIDAPGHGDSAGRSSSVLEVSAALLEAGRVEGPFVAAVTHSFGCSCLLHAVSQGLAVDRIACLSPPNRMELLFARFIVQQRIPAAVGDAMVERLDQRYGGGFWAAVAPDRLASTLGRPGLVIHDRDDGQVPWQQGAAIAAAWPEAELLLTSGLGHNRILLHRATLRQVVRFVAGTGPTTA